MSQFDPVGTDYDAEQEFECWCPDSHRSVFLGVPECPRHGEALAKRRLAAPQPHPAQEQQT